MEGFTINLSAPQRGILLIAIAFVLIFAVFAFAKIFTPFFIAFVLVYLLNPLVTWLSRCQVRGRQLGRFGAIVMLYGVFAFGLYGFSVFVLPNLYTEFAKLGHDLPRHLVTFERSVLPEFLDAWQSRLNGYNVPVDLKKSFQEGVTGFFDGIKGQFGDLAHHARFVVTGFFSILLTMVLVFMLTGFLLYDLPRLQGWLYLLVPTQYRAPVLGLIKDIDRGLAGAVRGQLVVCLVNGVLTTIGLMLLKVKFAITLGFVAGFCSLIPVFGTLFSSVPAVAIGLTYGIWKGMAVLAWILLIHLIEANLLNPNIIGHNAELHPALVVLALLIGEHFGGVMGLLFAVPLATVIKALLTYTLGRALLDSEPGTTLSGDGSIKTAGVAGAEIRPSIPPIVADST
jgi:predicted PurR-regulated permease PerM